MHIPDDTSSDEDILHAAEVRVLELVQHRNVVELDVQVLVDALERPADRDVVLELDCDGCRGVLEGRDRKEGREREVLWFVSVLKKLLDC